MKEEDVPEELTQAVRKMVAVYLDAMGVPEEETTAVRCEIMGPVFTLRIGVGEQAAMAFAVASALADVVGGLREPHLHTTPSGQDPDKPEIPRILM